MLYFLEKSGKIAVALATGGWGLPPPDPQVVTFTQLTCYFLELMLRFLAIKITTNYFILERRLVAPLAQLAPPPWLKSLVTPLIDLVANFVSKIAKRWGIFTPSAPQPSILVI